MQYKSFLLSELFNISTTKSVDKNKIEFSTDGEYDFIGRTSTEYGIQGHLHKLSFPPNPAKCFSLVQVGETVALWREKEWYASQNIFLLRPKHFQIQNVFLFFQTVINKEMRIYGNQYNSYPTMQTLAASTIQLPITDIGEIDWAYMEQYISELEQQRIAELDQYLIVSGLNDCELTEEDKAVLAIEQTKQTKEFRLADLFYSEIGDVDIQKKDLNGKGFDVVSAGRTDCGFVGKTDRPSKNIFSHTLTVDMFGNTFYRNIPYKMVTHARIFALIPKFKMNELSGQYIISKLFFLPSIFSYGNMCSWSKIQNIPVLLPVKTDSFDIPIIDNKHTLHPQGYLPDWDFAEHYIKIIEKIVINDVTHWKDKEIQLTKYLSKTESKDNLL